MVDRQNETVEKIGSTQNERRFWTVHKETTDSQLNALKTDWQMTQTCPHTPLFNSHYTGLWKAIPSEPDLLGQPPRSQ